MSFASEVKKELLNISDLEECCTKAFVFGVLQASSEVVLYSGGRKLVIKCTILNTLKIIIPLLKKFYNIDSNLSVQNEQQLSKRRFYCLEITNNVDKIIDDFKLMPFSIIPKKHEILSKPCCRLAFVRGLFVAKGSINDPRKECYHFEISSSRVEGLEVARNILKSKHIDSKIIERKNRYVLYIKKSEDISSSLALMGAKSGVFYFEDQRIVRDVANMANRMTNCDIANEIKCASNCDKQLEAIKFLKENGYFDEMGSRLQAAATLREEYPDSSYEELSIYSENVMGKYISKSGITHCLKDLMDYYNLKKNKELKN